MDNIDLTGSLMFGTLIIGLLIAVFLLASFLRKRRNRHPLNGHGGRNIDEIRKDAAPRDP